MKRWIPNLTGAARKTLAECLSKVAIEDRTTGPGKPGTIEYDRIVAMVPREVGEAFRDVPGALGQNIERAIRLFLEAQPPKR